MRDQQHAPIVLFVLALWPRFGLRRGIATGAGALALMAPWLIDAPRDLIRDTVTYLIDVPPLPYGNSSYLWFLLHRHVTLPTWATTGALLLALAGAAWVARQRHTGLPRSLYAAAAVLLVANLVNKQAFFNQYWLVAALVVIALAATPERGPEPDTERDWESAVPGAV